MTTSFSEVIAKSTIESLINKGKQKMQQKQIQKKMPNHANIQANATLQTMLNGIYPKNGHFVTLNPQKMISLSNNKQSWTPNNVRVNKQKLTFQNKFFERSGNQFLTIQQQLSSRKKNIIRNRTIANKTAFFSQSKLLQRSARTAQISSRKKYIQLEENFQDHKTIDQQQFQKRNQLQQKVKKQKQIKDQNDKYQAKTHYQKTLLKQQFQNAINSDKNIGKCQNFNPSKNEIVTYQSVHGKILVNLNKKNPKSFQNIINLRFQQKFKQKLGFKDHEEQSVLSKSRKASDYSKIQRGKVITDKQFNNSGLRQLSCIPYMTITHGVCLSQRSIQASVSRARPPNQVSRQKFMQTIQNNSFRSYSKQNTKKSQKQLKKIQLNKNQMKNEYENQKQKCSKSNLFQTNQTFGKSILWRPNTSRQKSRIKVNQLVLQQLIQ